MNEVLILSIESPNSQDARDLIQGLDDDLFKRYPNQYIHGLQPEDILDPDFIFVVARLGPQPVGCGALRRIESTVGEIKRMYIVPAFRGRGFSRQILTFLEEKARMQGYSTLRLETGAKQPEAIDLYRSAGYILIPCYGEYIGNPQSNCFEKQLS